MGPPPPVKGGGERDRGMWVCAVVAYHGNQLARMRVLCDKDERGVIFVVHGMDILVQDP